MQKAQMVKPSTYSTKPNSNRMHGEILGESRAKRPEMAILQNQREEVSVQKICERKEWLNQKISSVCSGLKYSEEEDTKIQNSPEQNLGEASENGL